MGPCAPEDFEVIDDDKVVQAFVVQMYAQVMDMVQQLDPLPADAVDAHEARVNQVTESVAVWLLEMNKEALEDLQNGRPECAPFIRGIPHDLNLPVQLASEKRVLAAIRMCAESRIDPLTFIHAAGEYLTNPDDHKRAWLAERAANLLAAEA